MAQIKVDVLRLENQEGDYEKVKLELQSKAEAAQGDDKLSSQLTLSLANNTKNMLYSTQTHFWVGHLPIHFPPLPPSSRALFMTTAPTELTWGFVYTNAPVNGPFPPTRSRQWVVAFDTALEKAYSEVGFVGPVDWDAIFVKLEKSGSKSPFAWIDGRKSYAIFSDEIPN